MTGVKGDADLRMRRRCCCPNYEIVKEPSWDEKSGLKCPNGTKETPQGNGMCSPFRGSRKKNRCAWLFQQFCPFKLKEKYLDKLKNLWGIAFESITEDDEKKEQIKGYYKEMNDIREEVRLVIAKNINAEQQYRYALVAKSMSDRDKLSKNTLQKVSETGGKTGMERMMEWVGLGGNHGNDGDKPDTIDESTDGISLGNGWQRWVAFDEQRYYYSKGAKITWDAPTEEETGETYGLVKTCEEGMMKNDENEAEHMKCLNELICEATPSSPPTSDDIRCCNNLSSPERRMRFNESKKAHDKQMDIILVLHQEENIRQEKKREIVSDRCEKERKFQKLSKVHVEVREEFKETRAIEKESLREYNRVSNMSQDKDEKNRLLSQFLDDKQKNNEAWERYEKVSNEISEVQDEITEAKKTEDDLTKELLYLDPHIEQLLKRNNELKNNLNRLKRKELSGEELRICLDNLCVDEDVSMNEDEDDDCKSTPRSTGRSTPSSGYTSDRSRSGVYSGEDVEAMEDIYKEMEENTSKKNVAELRKLKLEFMKRERELEDEFKKKQDEFEERTIELEEDIAFNKEAYSEQAGELSGMKEKYKRLRIENQQLKVAAATSGRVAASLGRADENSAQRLKNENRELRENLDETKEENKKLKERIIELEKVLAF